jgi:hypothetical protein
MRVVWYDVALVDQYVLDVMSDGGTASDKPPVGFTWDRIPPAETADRPGHATDPFRAIAAGADWPVYAAAVGIAVGVGIVNALSAAQDAAWRGKPYDLGTPLLWEMTSIVMIILAAPVLFVAVHRLRANAGRLQRIGLAISAIIIFSALHIAGMVALRKAVMWLLGTTYDFHVAVVTVLYEFRKDVVTSLLIGGTFWLVESRREARQSQKPIPAASEPPDTAPHTVWLRDGATRIRIQPPDVVWISSAGNYIEYSLANGTSHLVRGTLAGAEAELSRFNLARIHRTRLANLARVTGVEMKPSGDFELTLDTGHTIQGSRRYRKAVAALDQGPPRTIAVPAGRAADSAHLPSGTRTHRSTDLPTG